LNNDFVALSVFVKHNFGNPAGCNAFATKNAGGLRSTDDVDPFFTLKPVQQPTARTGRMLNASTDWSMELSYEITAIFRGVTLDHGNGL
jgi:hypothetical protein